MSENNVYYYTTCDTTTNLCVVMMSTDEGAVEASPWMSYEDCVKWVVRIKVEGILENIEHSF